MYKPSKVWINVEDKLPPNGKDVMVYRSDSNGCIEGYCVNGLWFVYYNDYFTAALDVTHWKPLPLSQKNLSIEIEHKMRSL